MVSFPADVLTELAAEWLRKNLRAPRPAPVHTRLTCMVPGCNGMSFVLLPAEDTSGNVCFRHYQFILRAVGKRGADEEKKARRRTPPASQPEE